MLQFLNISSLQNGATAGARGWPKSQCQDNEDMGGQDCRQGASYDTNTCSNCGRDMTEEVQQALNTTLLLYSFVNLLNIGRVLYLSCFFFFLSSVIVFGL